VDLTGARIYAWYPGPQTEGKLPSESV